MNRMMECVGKIKSLKRFVFKNPFVSLISTDVGTDRNMVHNSLLNIGNLTNLRELKLEDDCLDQCDCDRFMRIELIEMLGSLVELDDLSLDVDFESGADFASKLGVFKKFKLKTLQVGCIDDYDFLRGLLTEIPSLKYVSFFEFGNPCWDETAKDWGFEYGGDKSWVRK